MSTFTLQGFTHAIQVENLPLITSYLQHQDEWVDESKWSLNKSKVNQMIEKALMWCIDNNSNVFDTIFSYCLSDLNFENMMANASEKNRPAILRQLLELAFNKDASQIDRMEWEQALDVACARGHLECMEILLSHGCKIGIYGLKQAYRIVDVGTSEALTFSMSFPEMDAQREQVVAYYIKRRAPYDQKQGFVECLYDHEMVVRIYKNMQALGQGDFFDAIPENSPFKQRWNAECQRQALNAEVSDKGKAVNGARKL